MHTLLNSHYTLHSLEPKPALSEIALTFVFVLPRNEPGSSFPSPQGQNQ